MIIIVAILIVAGLVSGLLVADDDKFDMTWQTIEQEEYWRHGRHGA